ncbi:MAG: GWxTD domain-containing protein [Bacteroidetes bacterium]|nr:GWxTD domain-containing protein [Bacteroidota bacterium]
MNWVLVAFFLAVFVGCKTSSKLSSENLTTQLFYQSETFSPNVFLFHKSTELSMLHFSVEEKDLLFVNDGKSFSSKLLVEYSIFDTYSTTHPSDSGSVQFTYRSDKDFSAVSDSLSIASSFKDGSILRLKFKDLNRKAESIRNIVINSRSKLTNQSFIVKNNKGELSYNNNLSGSSSIAIESNFPGLEALWVRCYFRDFPLAAMPFRVIDDEKFSMYSDSVFLVHKNDFGNINLPRHGIYYFQMDTNLLSGLTINCMDVDFPKVTKPEQLIEATRYLTTRKEYEHLMHAENKKAELDAFWLEVGGSPERARGLIRAFYNRVQDANRAFTSYMEGWKTDRGMIYLVMGQPISIYRDAETEQWTYSGLVGFPDILFIFRKMNNPFSNNDYALIRQPVYENVWYLAVDQWRQGRIVNDN